jgi:hypothetical protein
LLTGQPALIFSSSVGEISPEAVTAFWEWVPTLVVLFIALVRFLFYVHRRQDPHYEKWQPAEIVALRSIVLIVTGKPMTKETWKSVNLILLMLVALGIAAWVIDVRTDGRYRSPLRRFLRSRFGVTTSTPASNRR